MKTTNVTSLRVVYSVLLFLFICTKTFSQPDYIFKNPIHESGTSLMPGAIYLFTNVKTGVDARIEVMSKVGAVSLNSIDETWTGFDEAFQPFIHVPAHSNGHIEFEIRFYRAGTTSPMNQTEVPITPIDVDGAEYDGGFIYEYDQIKLSGGYYNFSTSTSEISVTQTAGWVRGKNTSGWAYDGVDTTARNVMFTVVNANTNKVWVRIGAENTSDDDDVRYRSVYFKKFSYPNGLLASNSLMNFEGKAVNNVINLQYLLNEPSKVQTVVVERASSDMNFKSVQEITIQSELTQYKLQDQQIAGTSYYRLKITQVSGVVTYSNILRFEDAKNNTETLKVFPSVVNDHATVMFHAIDNQTVTFQLFDYNGRVVYNKQILAQKGTNTFMVDALGKLSSGNYIAVIKGGNQLLQQKIVKQ
jgi:hypothetical protein